MLVTLIVILIIVGLLLYLAQLLPLDARIILALQVLIVLVAVLWLTGIAGLR